LKLKAGEIDGSEIIPYARVAELQTDPNLRVELWPSIKTVFYIFNQRPTLKDGGKNPLADLRVRQALNYAVNKQAIIQITTHGLGTPTKSFLSSATPLVDEPTTLYPYDPAKAKTLLKEAGYENGFEVSVFSLAGNQDENTNATAMQQMFAAVGVKLKIEQIEMASRLARWKAGDFQMRGMYWTDDLADPSEATSYYVYSGTNGALHSGWADAKADALFNASQQELDPEKRADEYKELQHIYNGNAPLIYLYEVPYTVAFRKQVKGFVQLPLGNNIFEGVYVDKA
jgi:peptide/nickel transport system substrate-binding protein